MYDKKVLSMSSFNSSQKKKIIEPCRDLSRVNYRKWDSTIKKKLYFDFTTVSEARSSIC